jgi:chitinase
MDDAALRLRIKVIRVSTRAAVHSLGRADPQVADVVARGRWLLDDLARAVIEQGTDELRADLEQARAELDGLRGAEDP